jgi:DMSO/TMAO reductase YedYZ molybdopterin-dependent catalytic subunit
LTNIEASLAQPSVLSSTKWSKLDTVWRGVSVDTLLEGIETSAEYVAKTLAEVPIAF